MYNKNEMQAITVSISLKDLKELQEKSEFYFLLSEENEKLRIENARLREQLKMEIQ